MTFQMSCRLITMWRDIYKNLACTWSCDLLTLQTSKLFLLSVYLISVQFVYIAIELHLNKIKLSITYVILYTTKRFSLSIRYTVFNLFHSVSIHVEIIFRSYGNTLPPMTTCTSSAIACISFSDRIFFTDRIF